jgi:hypothetical protein
VKIPDTALYNSLFCACTIVSTTDCNKIYEKKRGRSGIVPDFAAAAISNEEIYGKRDPAPDHLLPIPTGIRHCALPGRHRYRLKKDSNLLTAV